jgi:trypsin-like peptidase
VPRHVSCGPDDLVSKWPPPAPAFRFGFQSGEFVDLLDGSVPHPLQRAIMPIVIRREGHLQIAGTAFAVGSALFLTAAHILRADRGLWGEEFYLLYIGGENADGSLLGGLLPISSVNFNDFADIALMRVMLPLLEDEPLRHSVLAGSFRSPDVGDHCVAIGYTAGLEIEIADDREIVSVRPRLNASRGVVEQVHLARRDEAFLTFPVFQTSARFDFQMSGSPIFAGPIGRHVVRGLVATGFEHDPQTMETSYGSLLWPAAGLRDPATAGREHEASLLDLAREGTVEFEGTSAVDVDRSDEAIWQVAYRSG